MMTFYAKDFQPGAEGSRDAVRVATLSREEAGNILTIILASFSANGVI